MSATITSNTNNASIKPGSDLFPYQARIINGATTLTITIPTESKGDRVLTLDKSRFRDVAISDREQSIVDWLTEDAPVGISYEATVTLGELKHLSNLGQRITTKYPSVLDDEIEEVKTEDLPEQMKAPEYVPSSMKENVNIQEEALGFVRRTLEAKVSSWKGMDETERTVNTLKARAEVWNQPFVTIEYDIKDESSKNPDMKLRVDNPSARLWKLGMRKSLSSWFIPARNLPSIQDWIDHAKASHPRNRVWVYKVSQDDVDQMRADALEALRSHLVNLHTSLIDNLGAAEERFQKAMNELTPEQREMVSRTTEEIADKRANTIRAHLRKTQAELKTALECAERYDMNEETSDLLEGLRNALKANASAFNVQMRQQRRKTFAVDAFVCR